QGVAGKKYSFSTDTKYVTLTGNKDALKKIDSLEVPVSLVGVNDNETRTISLDSDRSGITAVSPSSIQVTINVTDEKSAADNSSQGSAATTSPATGNNQPAEAE